MPPIDPTPSAPLDHAWRRARKAINQWLDGDDDRRTRVLFVCGDAQGGALALAEALGSVEQAWCARGWPLAGDILIGPDATELAAWVVPADILVLPVPGESPRAAALLAAHPTALLAWTWRPWREAVQAHLAADPTGGAAALRDLVDGRPTPGLAPLGPQARDHLAQHLTGTPTPGDAAALTWAVRHGVVLDDPLCDDVRAVKVSLEAPSVGLETLCGRAGLAAPAGPSLPSPPPGEAAEVDAAIARWCDTLADALSAPSIQAA